MAALTAAIGPTAGATWRRPSVRTAVRIGAGLAVVAATALVVGLGPFVQGIMAISPPSILAAFALVAIATAAASWRWRVVARGLGLPLPWHEAFGAYYRSQFLNTVLPGGVVGDVHRAYVHGHGHGHVGLAARAVAAERVFGQLVQFVLTLAILLALGLGSPLVPVAWGAGALAALIAVAVAVAALVPRSRRMLQKEYRMLRPLLVRPVALLAIALASVVVVAAHVALFVVAGIATGAPAAPRELAIAGLLVLAASAIPISAGGWGPREAAAGAAFAIVGLGAAAGVAASTAFGVLALVAVTPGALVLLAGRWHKTHHKGGGGDE